MQRTRRTTVLILLFIGVLVGIGLFGNRLFPRREASPTADSPLPSTVDELHIEGRWTVSVRYGESPSVSLDSSAPGSIDRYIEVDGDELTLRGLSGVRNAEALVTLPTLRTIAIDGASHITVDDFDLDTLEIDIDGAANVYGVELHVDALTIETDGAARVDLSASQVVHATIDIDGAGSVDLTMAGGVLMGSIDGVGRVVYGGTVSREDIDIDGLGAVESVQR